ncbi:MAG: hypothetical protein M3Q63_01885 [bacterium]|nr:hypothetical protein [bacterium]
MARTIIMPLGFPSASQEAFENKKKHFEEKEAAQKDVDVYLKLKENIESDAADARTQLALHYPDVFELLRLSDEENDLVAAKEIGGLRKTNEEAHQLVLKANLKTQFEELKDYIQIYVAKVHESVLYSERHGAETTDDSKAKQSRIETDRSLAHNALIDQLQSIRRNLKNLAIDIGYIDVVGFRGNQFYRADIQRWAQHVADYLVTLSRTTT